MPNIGDIIRADDLDHIIGQIIAVPYNSAPKGTLICDGSEISREAYSELFAVIGTNNGEGDGTTTFNIPDLRDKWIKYAGTENNVGEILAEGLPNITGTMFTGHSLALFGPNTGSGVFRVDNSLMGGSVAGTTGSYAKGFTFNAARSSAIYGNSTHVTPNSIILLPCIIFE